MTLDAFFEKFELFAEAPGAVAKMREMVLEMAIQGRLASALPNDGTVPPLTELRENAVTLVSSLGLRTSRESVEEVNPPFDIPKHWRWVSLADIGAAQTGTTPSKADHNAFNGDVPFIKPADIFPNAIDYSNESLTRHGAENGSRLATGGSLLMVCIGTIGKCNLIDQECAFNQQINSLSPINAVDSKYLLVAVRSRFFQDTAWKKSSSTTIAILNKGKWLSIPIPLPPLAEQKRIVAKVDELMALCDRLEAQLKERKTRLGDLARASLARFSEAPTLANLEFLFHQSYAIPPADLRKSILTLAVQGSLSKNTSDWKTATLKQVCSLITDGEHATPERISSGIPLATAKNVRDGYLDLAATDFVEQATAEKCWRRCKPKHDDILMVCVGATTGRVCWVENPPDIVLVRSVALLRPIQECLSSAFLNLFLRSPLGQNQIWGGVKQNAQPCLYLSKMNAFELCLPPLAEQRRIVAKVNALMALVDALEAQLAEADAKAENLLSAIITQISQKKLDVAKGREKIIDLQFRPEFFRSLLASEIVSRLGSDATFGQTKLQKILYLAEYMQELSEIESRPIRYARGPHDPELIKEVESKMKALEWFQEAPRRDGLGHQYLPLKKAGEHAALFEKVWPKKQAAIRALLDQMKTWKTERCERFSTLYAAWNDLMIWGHEVTEESILREVLERWHPDKNLIPRSKWIEMLDWMESKGYVPTGFGRATTHAPQGQLF